jgi:hypothetical protein
MSNNISESYYLTQFDSSVRTQLESGAFLSLCEHLSNLSQEVQNIDMMCTAGFNRTCLSKWLVRQARIVAKSDPEAKELLDAYGHSQAARDVYGCDYHKWRKEFEPKPTIEQMQKFKQTEPMHAVHTSDTVVRKGMTVAMTETFNQTYRKRLQAGAFRMVCKHLRERTDEVSNIALKTVTGFDRNDLAKWIVMEARKLAAIASHMEDIDDEEAKLIHSLDELDIERAAVMIYGCAYSEWASQHEKEPTRDELNLCKSRKSLFAKHDETILANRGDFLPDVEETLRPDKLVTTPKKDKKLFKLGFIFKRDDI